MKKKTYKLADKLKYAFAKVPVKPGKVYDITFLTENGEYYLHDLRNASKSYPVLLGKLLRKTEAELEAIGISMPETVPKNAINLFCKNFYTLHSRKGTDPTWGPYIK